MVISIKFMINLNSNPFTQKETQINPVRTTIKVKEIMIKYIKLNLSEV